MTRKLFPPVYRMPSLAQPSSFAASIGAILCVLFSTGSEVAATTSVTTTPVGVFTLTIAAGTSSASTLSTVSLPLQLEAALSGAMTGRITGLTASTITNSSAGWTAGALSASSAPCLLEITSGSACGRTFLISTSTANTDTTLTIASEESSLVDLTKLGIATGTSTGDTYRILACDTIGSVFGTPSTTGVQDSVSASSADNILVLYQGAWLYYYYSTTYASWRRTGINSAANNTPLRPDSLILYTRRGTTAMSISLLGKVPVTQRQAIVRPSGYTALAAGWPVSTTLTASSIQTISGWNASTSAASADRVLLLVNGAWLRYYYDGSNWRRSGINTISDSLVIPAGSGVLLEKNTSTTSASTLVQSLPYTL